jgi:2-polyprenyl-3-methyl-5-hydroxy-6-metoxy-1,4-benzoquinol methylase
MNPAYIEQYRQLFERHWWWRAREQFVLEAIARFHRPNPDEWVLDVGCGDGLFFDQLARFGTVEGVEVEPDAVSPDNPHAERIHVRPFDETFQPGRTYALITILDVLEHLDDARAALAHAASLLAPGGTLMVTVPAFRSLWTRHDALNHHRTRYTRSTLLPLFTAAGLDVVHSRYLFHWTAFAKLAVRLKELVIPGDPQPPRVGAHWINRLLLGLTLAEERIARPLRLPFGTSLLVIARLPAPSGQSKGAERHTSPLSLALSPADRGEGTGNEPTPAIVSGAP